MLNLEYNKLRTLIDQQVQTLTFISSQAAIPFIFCYDIQPKEFAAWLTIIGTLYDRYFMKKYTEV